MSTQVRELVLSNGEFNVRKILAKQHPIINTWLALNGILICFMFVLFFVI